MEKLVGIIAENYPKAPSVFSILADAYGLTLVNLKAGELHPNLLGTIVVGDGFRGFQEGGSPTLRVSIVEGPERYEKVRFENLAVVPEVFRAREVFTESVVPQPRSEPSSQTSVLLYSSDGTPLWTVSSSNGYIVHKYWTSRELFDESRCMFEHLNGRKFLRVLPILEWFRSISGWYSWQHPPLRACFIFDDPNLHSEHYGYISFRELVAQANTNHYHAAFATVPIDSYYVSRHAAKIFRENPRLVSLLVHGNNHTSRELALHKDSKSARRNILQASARIQRLESLAGFKVSRVMAPPHGACSSETMAALAECGFEAACISHGSLRTWNSKSGWVKGLGPRIVTVVNGLPVMPRFPLVGTPENSVLLSAYLHQAILPMGHHEDLQNGYGWMTELATFINRLGNVSWLDMSAIAGLNYSWRVSGSTMVVELLARKASINIPNGIEKLSVRSICAGPQTSSFGFASESGPLRSIPTGSGTWECSLKDVTRADLNVSSSSDLGRYDLGITSPHALGRRILCELRDRVRPLVSR